MVLSTSNNAKKEEFSYAYVHAVASVAGFSVEIKRRLMDNAGIDLTIEVPGEIGELLFPKFDAQVKCTSSTKVLNGNHVKYPLDVNNYKKLIHPNPLVPQLLIIVIVPQNIDSWINISETETLMKRCGYWVSLKGKHPTQNTDNITIDIPRSNLFTPSSLLSIMEKISKGEQL